MLNALKNETNRAMTENGAVAYKTTKSALVDLFAVGGALRTRSESEIISLFTKAFAEDNLLALKMLFYFRDARGGQGERNTFQVILKYMANNHPKSIEKNVHLIPFFGRWDDLFVLVDTKLEAKMFELMKAQFESDMKTEHPSLLGKWLKSENASSSETKKLARKTQKAFGLSERNYRKALTSLRSKIQIVETLMSSKRWTEIEYPRVPSQASLKYRNAFQRNDEERYVSYLESVAKGEAKINADVLFPYEIVRRVDRWGVDNDTTLDLLWENLPNYIGDKQENSLAVVDVSGSMSGLPMEVAVSVGLYLAERNKGLFHNHFITFSKSPNLVQVQGSSLCEKVRNMERADWGMNTDVEAVFDLVLNAAVKNKISKDEMVKRLYIISDMEFDRADQAASSTETLFETIRSKYEAAGYELPELVFWNVDSRNDQQPMTMDDKGVLLVSGCSPSIFQNILRGEFVSPYDLMVDVLNSERYAEIQA